MCGEQLWNMEFYDIDTLMYAYENVNDRIGRYKTLLGMVNVDYFCYEHGKGEADFIRIVNGQERVLYSVRFQSLYMKCLKRRTVSFWRLGFNEENKIYIVVSDGIAFVRL